MPYYKTGRQRTHTFTIEYEGNVGSTISGAIKYTDSFGFRGLLPIVSISFSGQVNNNVFELLVGDIRLTYPLNNIVTVSGSITLLVPTIEAIVFEPLQEQYYDIIGMVDYPLKRKMRIVLLVVNNNIVLQATLNNQSATRSYYYDFLVITNYVANVELECRTEIFVNAIPNGIQVNTSHSNTGKVSAKWNGQHCYLQNVSESKSESLNPPYCTVNSTASVSTVNGLMVYTNIQVVGTVPPPSLGYFVRSKLNGWCTPKKGCDVRIRAYNLNEPNTEPIPFEIFGEQLQVLSEYERTFSELYNYTYYYELRVASGDTKTGYFVGTNPNYNTVKITSPYRFLFRTFLYDIIDGIQYSDTLDVGEYGNVSKYEVIKDAHVSSTPDGILLEVYNEGGGLSQQEYNPNYSLVRYHISDTADFYMDSHRYLKLKLKGYYQTDVNIVLHINQKEYPLSLTLSTSNPTEVYVDLCKAMGLQQVIDLKNNNFDEDDSYARFWGITKTRTIDIEFDASFYIQEIKLSSSNPNLSDGRRDISFVPSTHTWQSGKRRGIVARFYGKQVLELPDARTDVGELTIDEVLDEINTDRWNGWTCTKKNFNLSSCSGTVQDLRPCLLNLYLPASFINGAGNTYDGSVVVHHVKENFADAFIKAQVLVDEIEYYPDCGDVFWQTTNDGNLKLYACVIRRGQANGIIFTNPNTLVRLQNSEHVAGEDNTDGFQYYYTSGDGAKHNELYTVYVASEQTSATRTYYDRNEYRICILPETVPTVTINDLDCVGKRVVATSFINDGEDGIILSVFPNAKEAYQKRDLRTTCLLYFTSSFYGYRDLVMYDTQLKGGKTIGQISQEGEMYPFVRNIYSYMFVTVYNPATENFNVRIYSNTMQTSREYENVIQKDVGETIPPQNFPVDEYFGAIVGAYYSVVGNDRFLNIVLSSDFGATWKVVKKVAI